MKELVNILMLTLIYSVFIPVIIGLLKFKKFKNTHWKWFFAYLLFILISGLGNKWIKELLSLQGNDFYIFFVIPIEFLFFYWLELRHLLVFP